MMIPTTIALIGLTAFAAVWLIGRRDSTLATETAASPERRATSPIDEAERLLAHRYAKGQITAVEYDRMLVILRH